MGHTNYNLLILTLIQLKDEFYRIKSERLKPLIGLLRTKSIKWVDGCEEVPSNKELAAELNYKVARCNSMLTQLMEKLLADFEFNEPLEIDEVRCRVLIMLHWEQYKKAEKNKSEIAECSFSIDLKLGVIPRIGEFIEFKSLVGNRFDRGIVHQVTHHIQGKTQLIEIHAHPWDNDYKRWMRLKDEYDRWGKR